MNSVQIENGMLQGSFSGRGFQEANQTDFGLETIRQIQVDKATMQGNIFFCI
jgi:hypothetical protein